MQTRTKFYRFLEIMPGALTWTSLLGAGIFSYFAPFWVAIYIILFDFYWVLKAINTSMHLLSSFFRLKLHAGYDWMKRLEGLKDIQRYKQSLRAEYLVARGRGRKKDLKLELERLDNLDLQNRPLDHAAVYHLVVLPTYQESFQVLDNSIRSITESNFNLGRIIFILATEERDRVRAAENSRLIAQKYAKFFLRLETVMHPDGIAGEIKAKGANLTYAAKRGVEIVRELNIPAERVVVSAFDSDTVVSRDYFAYLTYAFLTAEKPYRSSYQPMPVYNNNIWDAPAITRVVAISNSFWQMVEASRPDRLVTFSSQAISLKALLEVNFWPVDVISDDSQIFYRCWLHYHGDYRKVPLFTTVSLDAMLDETYFRTLIGQYKQKRRWAWGVENFPYLVTNALPDRQIPLWKKFIYIERELEGKYFWATASIMISVLGWLPLILGGQRFSDQILAFNLPLLTRVIMQVATLFLIFSVYINMVILPKRPEKYSKWKTVNMILQWIFVPIVSSVFGSFPAIDAQTRLMLGKYMEFWVTPKARRTKVEDPAMVFTSNQR